MSQNEVTVHVNRGSSDTLETDASTFETRGSFSLVLQGHETPAHVHCRIQDADSHERSGGTDDFTRIASVDSPNYYVEPDETTIVPIAVDAAIDEPIAGRLEVLTGYGAESVTIDVTVKPKPPDVEIDESLAKPRSPDERAPQSTADRLLERVTSLSSLQLGTIAVLGLGLVALMIATSTAMTIGGPAAMIGLVIVAVGVAVALFLLVW